LFIPDTDPDFLPIPDPGAKKAPDPGSATLLKYFNYCFFCRTTWKRYLPPSVLFKFVLGDTGCPIDPLWRLRPDVCSPWPLQVPSRSLYSVNAMFRIPVQFFRMGISALCGSRLRFFLESYSQDLGFCNV
jgi:hypothetical protein